MNYKRLFIPNSLIFITVVTNNRKNILTENIQYLRKAFEITKTKYEFEIIAIIVNKDHFHMIIKPDNIAPKDWKYSSFQQFVKNGFYDLDWCNFHDIHKINELNYE